jgi:predicted RNA-binding Zn-ribbon protein involved in translation (DUF1610 family)
MKKHLIPVFLMLLMLGNAIAISGKTTSASQYSPVNSVPLVSYTCTMHPDVTSDKPGQCPVCGMDLVQKTAEQYTCPMHPEVTGTAPGKCPECGMALALKSAALYACPMHPEVTSTKPGKCSVCGMALQKNKTSGHAKHGCCGK